MTDLNLKGEKITMRLLFPSLFLLQRICYAMNIVLARNRVTLQILLHLVLFTGVSLIIEFRCVLIIYSFSLRKVVLMG